MTFDEITEGSYKTRIFFRNGIKHITVFSSSKNEVTYKKVDEDNYEPVVLEDKKEFNNIFRNPTDIGRNYYGSKNPHTGRWD